VNEAAHAAQAPPPEQQATAGESEATLGDLAVDSAQFVRAWSALLANETRLAGASMLRLVFGLLVVPALALGICLALDALLATLLQRWLQDWASCIAAVLCFNLACLFGLLVALRRWWRNLSLPRSRAALVRLFEHIT
jgi:hypothetical protein